MKPALLAAAVIVLTLGGCGGGEAEDDVAVVTPEGGYADRIAAMDEGERNGVFLRAIRDAGGPCQQVRSSAHQGDVNQAPTWTATCEDQGQWVIAIGDAGEARVTDASAAAAARGAQPQ